MGFVFLQCGVVQRSLAPTSTTQRAFRPTLRQFLLCYSSTTFGDRYPRTAFLPICLRLYSRRSQFLKLTDVRRSMSPSLVGLSPKVSMQETGAWGQEEHWTLWKGPCVLAHVKKSKAAEVWQATYNLNRTPPARAPSPNWMSCPPTRASKGQGKQREQN